MSSEIDQARDKMLQGREELITSISTIISEWMKTNPDAQIDPDFALGIAVGALAQVGGDYAASHKLLYGYGQEWSNNYIAATSKMFASAYATNVAVLSQGTRNNPSDESFKN